MLVTFTQNYRAALDHVTIADFIKDHQYDLEECIAKVYIERGVCKKKEADFVEQDKAIDPAVENQAVKRTYNKKAK